MSVVYYFFFFFKQKTAYEMRISDWSSDVCSSDLGFSHEMGQSLSSWMGGAIEQSLSAGSFVRTGGVGRALRAWSGPRCRLIGQSLAGQVHEDRASSRCLARGSARDTTWSTRTRDRKSTRLNSSH